MGLSCYYEEYYLARGKDGPNKGYVIRMNKDHSDKYYTKGIELKQNNKLLVKLRNNYLDNNYKTIFFKDKNIHNDGIESTAIIDYTIIKPTTQYLNDPLKFNKDENEKLVNSCLSFVNGPNKLRLKGKIIITFEGKSGMYNYSMKDKILQSKCTGVTIYAFDYPGIAKSTGTCRDLIDFYYAGMGIVEKVFQDYPNINPEDVILQGNCIGSFIALKIQETYLLKHMKLRVIVNNAFNSIPEFVASQKMIFSEPIMRSKPMINLVTNFLDNIGWDTRNFAKLYVKMDQSCVFTSYRHNDGNVFPVCSMRSRVIAYNAREKFINDMEDIEDSKQKIELLKQYDKLMDAIVVTSNKSKGEIHIHPARSMWSLHPFLNKSETKLKHYHLFELLNKFIKLSDKIIDLKSNKKKNLL